MTVRCCGHDGCGPVGLEPQQREDREIEQPRRFERHQLEDEPGSGTPRDQRCHPAQRGLLLDEPLSVSFSPRSHSRKRPRVASGSQHVVSPTR